MKKGISLILASTAALALAFALVGCDESTASLVGSASTGSSLSSYSAQREALVRIETEGLGTIAWSYEDEEPEFDDTMPYQSAFVSDAYGQTIHIEARDYPGYPGFHFVKWIRDGDDFATSNRIDVLVDGDAEYIAVFEHSDE